MLSAEVTVVERGRRSEDRYRADIRSRYGMSGMPERALCRIIDVSRHGARLELYSELPAQTQITLTLPGTGPVRARIVWSKDLEAGCFFQQPLDEAELERIFSKGHA